MMLSVEMSVNSTKPETYDETLDAEELTAHKPSVADGNLLLQI